MDDRLELGEVEALVRIVGAAVGVLEPGDEHARLGERLEELRDEVGWVALQPRTRGSDSVLVRGAAVELSTGAGRCARGRPVRGWRGQTLTVRSARNFSSALTSTYAGPARPDE
jgi:hypothetical protein